MDISVTVRQVEDKYANSGKGRPRYPVRSMLLALLFMRFEAIPSLRKLCRRLEKRRYAREICEFTGANPGAAAVHLSRMREQGLVFERKRKGEKGEKHDFNRAQQRREEETTE